MASTTPVSLPIDVPPLLLDGSASKFRLNFSSSLRLCLPDSSWLINLKWRELKIIRGPGFCLKIKFRWYGQRMEETLVEELGRWISRAEMWSQLLFSASLEVPERVQSVINADGRNNGEGPDVIIFLVRTSQLPAATELLLPKILPTAFFSDISLDFLFSSTEPNHSYGEPLSAMEIIPQIDTAIRGLWNDKIAQLAPILGKIGYLEGVSQKSEYISVISDAIANVGARSLDMTLKRSIERLGDNCGIESRVWGCLLGISNENKGRSRGILKSLVASKGDSIIKKPTGDSEEGQDILFLYEKDVEEDKKEELFFDDTSTDENSLFAWDEEGECGEGGKSDSLFSWEDEDDSSLFEAPGSTPLMDLGCFADKNDFSSFASHAKPLSELETFPQSVEDEGMIRI